MTHLSLEEFTAEVQKSMVAAGLPDNDNATALASVYVLMTNKAANAILSQIVNEGRELLSYSKLISSLIDEGSNDCVTTMQTMFSALAIIRFGIFVDYEEAKGQVDDEQLACLLKLVERGWSNITKSNLDHLASRQQTDD